MGSNTAYLKFVALLFIGLSIKLGANAEAPAPAGITSSSDTHLTSISPLPVAAVPIGWTMSRKAVTPLTHIILKISPALSCAGYWSALSILPYRDFC